MPSGNSRRVLPVLVLLLTLAACRDDGQAGAGGVPAETPSDTASQPTGDVIDPNFTVDTQRIPGSDTPRAN